MTEEVLAGGIANPGAVVRVGDTVRRPASRYAPTIHRLLIHLSEAGFTAPRPLELDGEREVMTFIEGDVPIPPYPSWAFADEALGGVGRLLRAYHEAVESFPLSDRAEWADELTDPHGEDVICHNDVCLENVVFRGGEPVALLDFDYAAPGRKLWDLAMTARMWVPMRPPGDPLPGQVDFDPFRRFRVIVDAYGVPVKDHEELVDAVIETKRVGAAFLQRHVDAGEVEFQRLLADRGPALDRQLEWLESNRPRLIAVLSG